jgi:putative hydrolase of the HAD superfamily
MKLLGFDHPPLMAFSRPTAILFDVDGTLLDDASAVVSALKLFHVKYGDKLGLSPADLCTRWRELLDLHFPRYLTGEISMQEQRRARIVDLFRSSRLNLTSEGADAVFDVYLQQYRNSWTTFPDTMPALLALRGYELAVLTNGDLDQQTQKLQATGLAAHFRNVFALSEIGSAKPHPDAFLPSCSRLGLDPQRCAYVGDSLDIDVRGSSSAGLMGIWLNRDRSGSGADVDSPVIHSLDELPVLMGKATCI